MSNLAIRAAQILTPLERIPNSVVVVAGQTIAADGPWEALRPHVTGRILDVWA